MRKQVAEIQSVLDNTSKGLTGDFFGLVEDGVEFAQDAVEVVDGDGDVGGFVVALLFEGDEEFVA